MSKNKKESFFWTSYSDLMTSLFFVMLVLFILVIVLLHNQNKQIMGDLQETTKQKEKLEQILQIDKQFKPLLESGKFNYLESSKKFVAKDLVGEIFEPHQSVIKQQFRGKAIEIGHDIENLLKKLSEENGEFHYQLVIEGNVANDEKNSMNVDSEKYYKLSYERALALYNLWRAEKINLRKYNTEIMICGSGLNGIDRDPKWYNNKRFVIQIIPKINPPKQ